jgi:streptogramin lyase
LRFILVSIAVYLFFCSSLPSFGKRLWFMVFLLGLLVFYRELLTVSEITQCYNIAQGNINEQNGEIDKNWGQLWFYCSQGAYRKIQSQRSSGASHHRG